MKTVIPLAILVFVDVVSTFLAVGINRRKERKQDTKLWVALMIGGFIFSQVQTEYLIWRNKRNMKKI